MNELSPDAFRQVERDAKTKITVATGTPQAGVAWLLRQSWKVKFICAAILMFLAYGLFATLYESPAVRSGATSRAPTCDTRMPLKERAECIIALESAAAALEDAEHQRQAAEQQRIQVEEKALNDEVRRQRNLALAKPLKEAFDKRLVEIAAANAPITDFAARQELISALQFQIFQIMRLSEHPLNRLPDSFKPARLEDVNTSSVEARTAPQGRGPADAAVMKACNQQPRPVCAEALTTHILKLPYYSAANYILLIVR